MEKILIKDLSEDGIISLTVEVNGSSASFGVNNLDLPREFKIKASAEGVVGTNWKVGININGADDSPLNGKIGQNDSDEDTYVL